MNEERLRQVDDELGRLARTRTARVIGWCCVGGWCSYVLAQLLPLTLP